MLVRPAGVDRPARLCASWPVSSPHVRREQGDALGVGCPPDGKRCWFRPICAAVTSTPNWAPGSACASPPPLAVPCTTPWPGAPAAATVAAHPTEAGAATPPGTLDRSARTTVGFRPVVAPAPRSDGAAPESPRSCPGHSSGTGTAWRTRSSRSGKPVATARSITFAERSALAPDRGPNRPGSRSARPA